MALREINSDAHADARVRTGRAAGPNRVRIFALWTGHGETAVPSTITVGHVQLYNWFFYADSTNI